jgi:RES domain-containing protein
MNVYRVGKCRFIDDLSGKGAALYGGRWNSKGVYVLYASLTASLALLENRVHMSRMPGEDYCLGTLVIPDEKITSISIKDLPAEWSRYPSPASLKKIGDDFISENKFLGMKIPSAILPEENNLLINPSHPDMKKVKLINSRSITIDERLFG